MPTIQIYPNGLTGGIPPRLQEMPNQHRALRGDVGGWSKASTRSNNRFLYSVVADELSGAGFALTLTLRDCPPTHEQWAALRRAFQMRLQRLGMIRMHWLTEWQRRGVPHLHAAAWFKGADEGDVRALKNLIVGHWLAVADEFGPGRSGQHVAYIHDSVGWFKYLAKHAQRGMRHYQRAASSIPPGWEKTGRMWGYLGDWPRREVLRFEVSNAGWYRFRRLVRSARIADSRASGDRRRIRLARTMLKCHDQTASELRGVSEWLPAGESLRFLALVASMGYRVEQVFNS